MSYNCPTYREPTYEEAMKLARRMIAENPALYGRIHIVYTEFQANAICLGHLGDTIIIAGAEPVEVPPVIVEPPPAAPPVTPTQQICVTCDVCGVTLCANTMDRALAMLEDHKLMEHPPEAPPVAPTPPPDRDEVPPVAPTPPPPEPERLIKICCEICGECFYAATFDRCLELLEEHRAVAHPPEAPAPPPEAPAPSPPPAALNEVCCEICGACFQAATLDLALAMLDEHKRAVHVPPAPPDEEERPCLIVSTLTPRSPLLPYLRLFRDRFLPSKVQDVYYGVSSWLLRGVRCGN